MLLFRGHPNVDSGCAKKLGHRNIEKGGGILRRLPRAPRNPWESSAFKKKKDVGSG